MEELRDEGESLKEAEPKNVAEAVEHTEKPFHNLPRRYTFNCLKNENGNILTVHHTVREKDRYLRIRVAVCCFNEQGSQFVAIDKRGNIFVFEFGKKQYWRLNFILLRVCSARASLHRSKEYLVGTKLGQLFIVDTEHSKVVKSAQVASDPILAISMPSKGSIALLRVGQSSLLLNLSTLLPTHRLDFDEAHFSLKFSSYLPYSDQFFTCFTNDSIHLWSSQTLNTLRIVQPIKARDRKLRLLPKGEVIPEFSLFPKDSDDFDVLLEEEQEPITQFNGCEQDYMSGYLLDYCFTPDGNKLCLTTWDNYLMLFQTTSFELEKLFKLRDFILKQCVFLPHTKERIIIGLTMNGKVVLLDCQNTDYRLIIQKTFGRSLRITRDGKLLAVLSDHGEVNIWSTCRLQNALKTQQQSVQLIRSAFKQPNPVLHLKVNECLTEDVRKLLKRERMLAILHEYGCYPGKYRQLIWSALLQLPCNVREFQTLLKLGTPEVVKKRAQSLNIKSDAMKRALAKVWSCLAHWCKVFAHADFIPQLIFPFVKVYPKSSIVCFELCVTLMMNHFQLWFEFHPLEPANYLALCENLLQRCDPQLCQFYASLGVKTIDYIWLLLTHSFSEVLDEEQWLSLWDNIISEPPYFLVFVTVAYNLLQREVLLRLPDKTAVLLYFHEQNPIDVSKLVSKARCLMTKCIPSLHPTRYMQPFSAIPKKCYPKFLNYPREWLNQQEEQALILQRENRAIDARIRKLELEEHKMIARLENGLKQEEHAKRVKEMEQLYQDTLRREEERVASQRKMLLLYQKEIRNRKGEYVERLRDAEHRKKAIEMEKDIGILMHNIERERRRNEVEMLIAEDEIRNQDMEILAQKYAAQTNKKPLRYEYQENIQRVCRERGRFEKSYEELSYEVYQKPSHSSNLLFFDDIEKSVDDIQREFSDIVGSEQ